MLRAERLLGRRRNSITAYSASARRPLTISGNTAPGSSGAGSHSRVAVLLLTTVLAWGVVSFGAVYPWGFTTLGLSVLALAAWQCRPGTHWSLAGCTAIALLAAVALQVVPLPRTALNVLSPHTLRLAMQLDVGFANGISPNHALSVSPNGTWLALIGLAVSVLWVPTCTSILGQPRTLRRLARNLTAVGTAVALLGLAHKATYNGKVLWFWTPELHAWNSFGPFVNRNHFAGWMVLALGLSVGLFFGTLRRASPPSGTKLRERFLWLGSPAASGVLSIAAASFVMTLSIVWSMSRSGILAACTLLCVMIVAALVRSRSGLKRLLVVILSGLAVLSVLAWRGMDTLFDWYGQTSTLEWRIRLWKDTWPLLQDFWLTGAGLNSYGTLLLWYPRTDVRYLPQAAHNDYLQLALEGGVLVTVPVLVLAGVLSRDIVRKLRAPQDETSWWIRMGAVAGICGIAVQEISEFSLQVPGIALLFSTCIAVAIHRGVASSSCRDANHAGCGGAPSPPESEPNSGQE